ncbi:hypothetical protein SS1G_10988 [Sclerotinia sclerotiorum 1980 UF-70]|uniref:Uncharacterized protein n=1 Tax=Sclerotinia sclerotiorum (strain ATCC 18683 / 1980 / Ss-1) TaxID=665079 RepID=A7F071_SCLS1|nr:hypothetical protein SS1G_10988 [Sclerotinia sclerotiorum 1980 UF-70]EDN95113.1 hypothetical protein SS1G_10988 [Sclerotinia sclerotiorum 1980 UF-70]
MAKYLLETSYWDRVHQGRLEGLAGHGSFVGSHDRSNVVFRCQGEIWGWLGQLDTGVYLGVTLISSIRLYCALIGPVAMMEFW